MLNKIITPGLVLVLIIAFSNRLLGQSDEIAKIIAHIKVSYELNKLNECRIKLRAIEYSQLKTKAEKEQYAEAYRQLALSFRNHRYIRPGYDIYQKYIFLRDTIFLEEQNKQVSETQKKNSDMHTAILDEIAEAEKEKKLLLTEKSTLDSLKKNNFWYSAIFTITLLGISVFILSKYNKKLKAAKISLRSNRKNIFEISKEVTKGQMSFGVINRLKYLNENIYDELRNLTFLQEAIDQELKTFKEAEQPLKNLKENMSQIKQLSEISSKTIANVLHKISRT